MGVGIVCGILGIASRSAVTDRRWLTRGNDGLAHRGPDDSGEWWSDDGRVGLAHRRLSIIDLSSAGHQPMTRSDGRCRVVFNGEIYNFRELRRELSGAGFEFGSSSDTEVLLASYLHWGVECLDRLNGMFAFAIYDAGKDAVFLARDRAGEKPLYYACQGGTIRFGSELKGLMADAAFPRRINAQALDCYLAFGYVPGDLCMLDGVAKLPPAHALWFDMASAEPRTWRYWSPPQCRTAPGSAAADSDDLLGQLESLLENAVVRQLVADVPIGVLLSGGLDSSLVAAFAARKIPAIKTFTVRFPGFRRYDESPYARLVARHLGSEHIELESSSISPDVLFELATSFDEPMADSSMVPTFLISRLVRQHCKVVLGGDGGDELFGGYKRYTRYASMHDNARLIPGKVRTGAAVIADKLLPDGFRGRNWLSQFAVDWRTELPDDGVHFDTAARRSLTRYSPGRAGGADAVWRSRTPDEGDIVQRATRMDFENYLPEKILVKVDRASMANSLEVRSPFLDRQVVEFAFADVPSDLKVDGNRRKLLLKKIASRILPSDFDVDRKQGFSIPLAQWLRAGPWRDFFHDVLTGGTLDGLDRQSVLALLEGQAKGRSNSERLFALVMFELWRREYLQ